VIDRLLERLNLVQRSRGFKIAATIGVALVIIGVYGAAFVYANKPDTAAHLAEFQQHQAEIAKDPTAQRGSLAAHAINTILTQLGTTDGAVAIGIGFAATGIGAITVIWLGLSLTYLCVLAIGLLVAWPLASFGATQGFGRLILGIVPLALAFLTLLEVLRLALGASNPVAAIARNVLNEAVRMKISLVFIVLLLILLAVVPGLLSPDQPLRYRVQQWLQYGVGFSYAVLALLTAFLSVATVVFEQRDRIVWQTATKPVRAWQYVLGKWIGVMGLNAVLLTVSAAGVYLFTEYLRHQPANGESAYRVDLRGNSTRAEIGLSSTDRRLLEQQVLVARVGARPEPFRLTPVNLRYRVDQRLAQMTDPTDADRAKVTEEIQSDWDKMITDLVEAEIKGRTELDMAIAKTLTPRIRDKIQKEIIDHLELEARSIEPGGEQSFLFDFPAALAEWTRVRTRTVELVDLLADERANLPEWKGKDRNEIEAAAYQELLTSGKLPQIPRLTLRYKVQSGSNDPSKIFRIYFLFNGVPYPERPEGGPRAIETTLDTTGSISFPASLLGEESTLVLTIASDPSNGRTITIPPDGLEVLHTVGGYEVNFLRVMAALWVKLGFIAAVGIASATFLSFPVASLMTLGVLFMAESAAFLADSLEYFAIATKQGDIKIVNAISRVISWPIAKGFHLYANLQPTESLVDGRLLGWGALGLAVIVIGIWALVALGIGVAIYRRRELALYSGQ